MYNWPKGATLLSSTFSFFHCLGVPLMWGLLKNAREFFLNGSWSWNEVVAMTFNSFCNLDLSNACVLQWVQGISATDVSKQLRLSNVTNSGKSSKKDFPFCKLFHWTVNLLLKYVLCWKTLLMVLKIPWMDWVSIRKVLFLKLCLFLPPGPFTRTLSCSWSWSTGIAENLLF